MNSDERPSATESQGRAAEQIDRLVTDDRRARELVESLGEDGSGADQLAAMIAPPHDPADIDAMRGTDHPDAALEPDPHGPDPRGDPATTPEHAARSEHADRPAAGSQKPPWPTMHPADDYDGARRTPDDNNGDDARWMHEQLRVANNEHSRDR